MANLSARPLTFLLAILVLAPAFAGALAQSAFPTLTGRVVDEANLIDAVNRQDLTAKLAALEAKTTDQFVVVTIKSLGGRSIEDYGVNLGRNWKIGQAGKNNGVLLIVAPNERKVRIEVGYGLEGTLTDAISKYIIETSILPRFKAGDFVGGITRGADDIIQVLSGDAADFKQRASARNAPQPVGTFDWIIMLIVIIIAGTVVVTVVFNLLSLFHDILVGFGLARKKPKDGFWHWVDDAASATSSSSGSSGDSFSGGGGSFGGGGSSGSW
jgi:uncharacterized protein